MDSVVLRYIYDVYSQEKVYPILSIDFLFFIVFFFGYVSDCAPCLLTLKVMIGKERLNLANEWLNGLFFVLPPNDEQVLRLSSPIQQLSERKK
jgi:hypothetical protein